MAAIRALGDVAECQGVGDGVGASGVLMDVVVDGDCGLLLVCWVGAELKWGVRTADALGVGDLTGAALKRSR